MFGKLFRMEMIVTAAVLAASVLMIRLANSPTEASSDRAQQAEAARWTGLAHLYAMADTATDQQRAEAAEAARWTGLALQGFERTGDRRNLPQCIPAYVMALLPGFGDAAWRSMVPSCGQ